MRTLIKALSVATLVIATPALALAATSHAARKHHVTHHMAHTQGVNTEPAAPMMNPFSEQDAIIRHIAGG